MPLAPIALPALIDNYIWALPGAGGHSVLVDPGEAAAVERAINAGLQPCAILVTHHHRDHTGAVAELAARHGLIVYAPADPRIQHADVRVAEGDRLGAGASGLEFTVLEVPGHTRSHVAYFGHGVVFTGDTLFSLGCGRLFEGTPVQMHDSLQRLAALPPETRVCCAHEYTLANAAFARAVEPGNPALAARAAEARDQRATGRPSLPTTLAQELATNPFLRCDVPAVAQAIAARFDTDPGDAVACFAAMRRWKDDFVAP